MTILKEIIKNVKKIQNDIGLTCEVLIFFIWSLFPFLNFKYFSNDGPLFSETIPIEEVVFRGNDVLLGQAPNFFCDVKTNVPIREVFVKSEDTFIPATRVWSLAG